MARVLGSLVVLAGIAACSHPSPPQPDEVSPMNKIDSSSEAIHATLRVTGSGTPELAVHWQIHNQGQETAHVLHGSRMPYLLLEDERTLVVLHGVNPPDPDIDYNVIEIPTTRALAPGQSLTGTVPLVPLVLRHHFEQERAPRPMSGDLQVVFEVGWTRAPIEEQERHTLNIQAVLDRQIRARSAPVTVTLP